MNNTIQYTVDNDGIATLMLDLPGKSMNVLCDALIADLSECIEKVVADENVKVHVCSTVPMLSKTKGYVVSS